MILLIVKKRLAWVLWRLLLSRLWLSRIRLLRLLSLLISLLNRRSQRILMIDLLEGYGDSSPGFSPVSRIVRACFACASRVLRACAVSLFQAFIALAKVFDLDVCQAALAAVVRDALAFMLVPHKSLLDLLVRTDTKGVGQGFKGSPTVPITCEHCGLPLKACICIPGLDY